MDLLLGPLTSSMKVSLLSIRGTLSVNSLIVLLSIVELSHGEAIAIGCASFTFQYLWRTREKRDPVEVLFNLTNPNRWIPRALRQL